MNEDDASTDQLMTIIKYLRREKEIVYGRMEVAQSELSRTTRQLEHAQKLVQDLQNALDSERYFFLSICSLVMILILILILIFFMILVLIKLIKRISNKKISDAFLISPPPPPPTPIKWSDMLDMVVKRRVQYYGKKGFI